MTDERALAIADGSGETAHPSAPAHPSHTHANCLNCGATLQGGFCHVCGQGADDHHRSIKHLLSEALEGFTHLDGRLANTLPALLLHPGRLARDHIEGRRMRHIPPFRMFLISLLIFMFAAEWAVNLKPHQPVGVQHTTATKALHTYKVGDTKVVVTRASDVQQVLKQQDNDHNPLDHWLEAHVGRAVQNHELFQLLVFSWAHRLAILMLPILAGFLTLAYIFKRDFYVYDHLIVSMQYLSFCFLVWAVMWSLPSFISGFLMLPALIWTPFNLYLILRTAYGSSRLGAALKAVTLWAATVATFAALLVGLLAFTLNRM